MTNQTIEALASGRRRGFRLETFLPKRTAWIQTLILLPFGLPVGNFLGASWHFSVNAIGEDRQYPIGILSMAVSLLLPSLFFAFLFHWGWFIWHQSEPQWYPNRQALWAGAFATMTIAISFGLVALFTQSLGICGSPAWGSIGATLLCNLDGYGFEAKSWFGAWFIIAAYCYRVQEAIDSHYQQRFKRRDRAARDDLSNYRAMPTDRGDLAADGFTPTPTASAIDRTPD